jgi:two-component system sensor histidine kinase/response regulator
VYRYIKVIDTGAGMSKTTMEKIFDCFAMGEHKVSKYGGSGLGLAFCRSLTELMHGEIHCMSTPGEAVHVEHN